jgi:hypothetical protein
MSRQAGDDRAMNRLQAELQRLYLSRDAQLEAAEPEHPRLVGSDGRARAMVLELAVPAAWDRLRKVWQAVQSDLELPAPAIAVSGIDSYQLWFSLSEPVPSADAVAFLECLRQRYLGDVARDRIRTSPYYASAASDAQQPGVPPLRVGPERWSAFVAADLAALFADEPWLDLAPTPDAQADLLSRLQNTKAADFQRALERLGSFDPAAPGAAAAGAPAEAAPAPAVQHQDPRSFLLEVMNDRTTQLHLRIEAAKALLPCFEGQRTP